MGKNQTVTNIFNMTTDYKSKVISHVAEILWSPDIISVVINIMFYSIRVD